jgi:MFS family permease
MLVQAAALALLALGNGTLASAATAAALLGAGTALVYPTLIAAISDAVTPVERAPIIGIYRFWRDSGYLFGGLIAGGVADALGCNGAIACVATLTAASGLWVLFDMPPHDRPLASRRSTNERSAALPASSRARP